MTMDDGDGDEFENDSPLMVTDEPDEDGEYRLFFLRNGATVKCGYVFADAVEDVRRLLHNDGPADG